MNTARGVRPSAMEMAAAANGAEGEIRVGGIEIIRTMSYAPCLHCRVAFEQSTMDTRCPRCGHDQNKALNS